MTHGQQRDLVIKVHKPLDDHLALARASAFLRVFPRAFDVGGAAHHALALAGGAHDGLHHARHSDGLDGRAELLLRGRKLVGRTAQTQFLGGKAADPLAVHRQLGCARRGHHAESLGLKLHEHIGGDGLHFRDDEGGLFFKQHRAQGVCIEHRDHMGTVCHLHGWCVRVGIHGHHLAAEALEFDDHLLAELAGAEQQDLGGGGGKGVPMETLDMGLRLYTGTQTRAAMGTL